MAPAVWPSREPTPGVDCLPSTSPSSDSTSADDSYRVSTPISKWSLNTTSRSASVTIHHNYKECWQLARVPLWRTARGTLRCDRSDPGLPLPGRAPGPGRRLSQQEVLSDVSHREEQSQARRVAALRRPRGHVGAVQTVEDSGGGEEATVNTTNGHLVPGWLHRPGCGLEAGGFLCGRRSETFSCLSQWGLKGWFVINQGIVIIVQILLGDFPTIVLNKFFSLSHSANCILKQSDFYIGEREKRFDDKYKVWRFYISILLKLEVCFRN